MVNGTSKKQDIKKLEGFHFRYLRRLTRKLRSPELGDMEIDKASKKDVFGASRMPTIEELLREKAEMVRPPHERGRR